MNDDEILLKAEGIKKQRRREAEKQKREKALAYVGRCFRYRNSFGGDRPDWWLYIEVVGATKDGYAITREFQTDCDGRTEFRCDRNSFIIDWDGSLNKRAMGITRRRFEAALSRAITRVKRQFWG
jgi:hypothetical protein